MPSCSSAVRHQYQLSASARESLRVLKERCWDVPTPRCVTQRHTCMELVSPASHCSNKPQNTHRNPRQVEVCPSLEASTSSQGRAGLQKLSASHNIFPHLQSFIPASFPNRGTDSFQLQHRTMNSDRTWKRASCPNICSSSPQKQHLH